jgi:hypothetical protein
VGGGAHETKYQRPYAPRASCTSERQQIGIEGASKLDGKLGKVT